MKKISLFFAFLSTTVSFAQTPPSWSNGGNNANSGDFVGTINNVPLNFRTNNVQQMTLETDGSLKMNKFVGTTDRILMVDANGFLKDISPGSAGQFLQSNGVWANLPGAVYAFTMNANTLSTAPTTSLGLGLTNPSAILDVAGDGVFSGKVTATKGIILDNSSGYGISYNPSSSLKIISYGEVKPYTATCLNPNLGGSDPFHIFSGWVTSRALTSTVDAALHVGAAAWNGDGIIELEGTGSETSGDKANLMINYFCGRNTLINVNNSLPNGGGIVFMGSRVAMAQSTKIGYDGSSNVDLNTSLDIYQAANNSSAVKVNTGNNNSIKALWINNTNPGAGFIVMGDGKTRIGASSASGMTPYKMLTVNGDVSFANYGNSIDGINAFEVIGNAGPGVLPKRRGISIEDNNVGGKVNFYIHGWQPNPSFNFKNGEFDNTLVSIDVTGKTTINASATDAFEIVDGATNFTNYKISKEGSTVVTTSNNALKIISVNNSNPDAGFTVYGNGTTHIGKRSPLSTGIHQNARLAVDGKVIATSVFVTNAGGIWADYVFEKDYKLMGISELSKFLEQNKHLPGMPTALEVAKEGLDLGINSAKLLEKLEEAYLYILDLNKRIEELEKHLK